MAIGDRRRWRVVAILFVIAFVNYLDRQSLSVVAPRMQFELGMSDQAYAHVVSLFLCASAIAYGISGFIADRLGTRYSMAIFIGVWSMAEAATAFTRSLISLAIARFFLGMGEPGLWVAAPKAVAEIFPKQERNLAIGLYTAGATVGTVTALPLIIFLTTHMPWRFVFLVDGVAGIAIIPVWLLLFRGLMKEKEQTTSQEHPALLNAKTWRLLAARAITDPTWYFILFWFPKFLVSTRQMTSGQLARTGWIVYLGAALGTAGAGLLAKSLIRGGITVRSAYRRIMVLAAVLVPLSPLISFIHQNLAAVALGGVIALAHMLWLVTLTATIVEVFPQHQVGRAAGLIAMGSGFGGMLSSEAVGYLVTHHGYATIFNIMAFLHPIALIMIWPIFRHSGQIVLPSTKVNGR